MTTVPPVPGGPDLIALLVIAGVVGVLLGRWIYRDAKSRGSKWAWQWAVGIFFLFFLGLVPGLLGLVLYLLTRQ